MNSSLNYIDNIFRVSIGLVITSFLSLLTVFWYIDPFKESWYIWVFCVLLFCLSVGVCMLSFYFWHWFIQKDILFDQTINNFGLISIFFGSLTVFLTLLWQTDNLNIISLTFTFLCVLFYSLFKYSF